MRVICPVATSLWDEPVSAEMARFKDPDTVIEVVHLQTGPESLEDLCDDAYAAQGTLEEVMRAEQDGADGVIIYCYGDPALRAAKTAVSIPVVGLAEASSHLAFAARAAVRYRLGWPTPRRARRYGQPENV